jgi:hypothetical protein
MSAEAHAIADHVIVYEQHVQVFWARCSHSRRIPPSGRQRSYLAASQPPGIPANQARHYFTFALFQVWMTSLAEDLLDDFLVGWEWRRLGGHYASPVHAFTLPSFTCCRGAVHCLQHVRHHASSRC